MQGFSETFWLIKYIAYHKEILKKTNLHLSSFPYNSHDSVNYLYVWTHFGYYGGRYGEPVRIAQTTRCFWTEWWSYYWLLSLWCYSCRIYSSSICDTPWAWRSISRAFWWKTCWKNRSSICVSDGWSICTRRNRYRKSCKAMGYVTCGALCTIWGRWTICCY